MENFILCAVTWKQKQIFRTSRPVALCKKGFLQISQNLQESTCARGMELKKETLAQLFWCEFCQLCKTTSVVCFWIYSKSSKRFCKAIKLSYPDEGLHSKKMVFKECDKLIENEQEIAETITFCKYNKRLRKSS